MPPARTTVFLPCHTLDDFPTWLDEAEADDLLAAWTAAWHPALIAAVGGVPDWAAVDLPVADGPLLGIVPRSWDDRFEAQCGSGDTAGSVFVRGVGGVDEIASAAIAALGMPPASPLPGGDLVADFQALGLAALIALLLARRMRSSADLDDEAFRSAAVTAATAAVAGREEAAREALRECFEFLAATRGRYYPVDSWVIDLVLLGGGTAADGLAASLDSPGPLGVVATGAALDRLARERPEAIRVLREAVVSERVAACGGRDADGSLDLLAPEDVVASFDRGRRAWREHVGVEPRTFARLAGGLTHLLPQILAARGFRAVIWPAFDGSAVPDIGGGVARWESSGAAVDVIASRPLDAGSARTILSLHETLGDAMDHDHAVVLAFAHVAGRASRWHGLLRSIGGWSNLIGTFSTPDRVVGLVPAVIHASSFEPDAFPPTMPAAVADPVSDAVRDATTAANRIVAAAAPLTPVRAGPRAEPVPAPASARRPWRERLFGGRRDEPLSIDNGLIRVELNAATGGVLAVRRRVGDPNRLSQQLSIRTTAAAPAVGEPWVAEEDRQTLARMAADATGRETDEHGRPRLVSRGRLLAADDVAARFVQRVWLVPGMPLAVIDVEVDVERPVEGGLWENHVAVRFAWNENDHVELRRSVHTQSVATERTRFTAPHFVEIASEDDRRGGEPVIVLTGGLPWQLLSSPHVLDTVAGPAVGRVARRVAVGLGLERPWQAAIALLHGEADVAAAAAAPPHVRITVGECVGEAGRPTAARVGLLESAGIAGPVTIDWGRRLERAVAVDDAGAARAGEDVAIDGTRTVVSLARHQWLQLDLGFAG
jgi:hypothetical protein